MFECGGFSLTLSLNFSPGLILKCFPYQLNFIFFWVARMVMMGLKFTNDVPFREIYITGLIRDAEGQKMSKSKGNVLDPIDLADGISFDNLVEKRTANLMQPSLVQKIVKATKKEFPKGISAYGIDALRFTFCALASTGRNINFDIQRLEGYRNFCNKIWNSVRFVLMQDYNDEEGNLTLADRWINSVLQMAIKNAIFHIENYRFDLLASTLYEFVWHEYCDWYLEFYKAQKKSTQLLVNILSTWLRLIHPSNPKKDNIKACNKNTNLIFPFFKASIAGKAKGFIFTNH